MINAPPQVGLPLLEFAREIDVNGLLAEWASV
jgi:hypothetical protein